jgi:hypothetical protein
VLDASLSTRHPSDYTPAQGARFEVHIEKGRGLHGEDAKPFEARLDIRAGKAAWSMKDAEDATRVRVAALLAAGMSVSETAEEIDTAKSVVHRMKQKIEGGGGRAGRRRIDGSDGGCLASRAPSEGTAGQRGAAAGSSANLDARMLGADTGRGRNPCSAGRASTALRGVHLALTEK